MIGLKVAELREQAGISQNELGRRAGVTGRIVSYIELGVRPNPTLSTILALARGLGVPPSELIQPAAGHDQAPELVEVGEP